jgi:hypothetical protein
MIMHTTNSSSSVFEGNRPMTIARRTRHQAPKTYAAQARARSTCVPGPYMFLKLGNGGFGWFGARMGSQHFMFPDGVFGIISNLILNADEDIQTPADVIRLSASS